jgi:IS5 family transposase
MEDAMQMTFGMYEDQDRRQKKTMLDEILQVIDFGKIERILQDMYTNEGRPPIPPLILFKILLLEAWYRLSDVQVVEEIHDRRSFERFVGKEVRKYYLDDTTLVKFRNRMRAHQVEEKVWAAVEQSLVEAGVLIRHGTIVDSTMVKGACRPGSKRKDGTPVDEDIHCTARKKKVIDGMKVHVSMDSGSEIIRRVEISHIEEHDHGHLESMLTEDTEEAIADKAYKSKEHDRMLRRKKVKNRILRKARRNCALSDADKRWNRRQNRIRTAIERKMNDLKRWCGLARMRFIGLARNRLWVMFGAMACNLKRSLVLLAA